MKKIYILIDKNKEGSLEPNELMRNRTTGPPLPIKAKAYTEMNEGHAISRCINSIIGGHTQMELEALMSQSVRNLEQKQKCVCACSCARESI